MYQLVIYNMLRYRITGLWCTKVCTHPSVSINIVKGYARKCVNIGSKISSTEYSSTSMCTGVNMI